MINITDIIWHKEVMFVLILLFVAVALKELTKTKKRKNQYRKPKEYNLKNQTTQESNNQSSSKDDLIYMEMKQQEQEQKQANTQKGKDYEIFVGSHYENVGYAVKYFGFERGKGDGGIDIVATKDNEALFIQCKNWSKDNPNKINHEKIKAFIGSVAIFKNDNPEYKALDEKLLYITSNDIFDNSAKYYCEQNREYIRYKIMPFTTLKLTTNNLAKLHDMKTKDMEQLLKIKGYLKQKEKGLYLSDKGKEVGEWRSGEGKGYFLWDKDIEL
jgi:restriction system protein